MIEALRAAYAEVEDQEDEHLYHTKGWARVLWIESLELTTRAAREKPRRADRVAPGSGNSPRPSPSIAEWRRQRFGRNQC
jgi:hypothetical protein